LGVSELGVPELDWGPRLRSVVVSTVGGPKQVAEELAPVLIDRLRVIFELLVEIGHISGIDAELGGDNPIDFISGNVTIDAHNAPPTHL
jgi:hypothetical protein